METKYYLREQTVYLIYTMKPGCTINTIIRLNNLTELCYILCAINPFFYICVLGKIINFALQKKAFVLLLYSLAPLASSPFLFI